MQLRLIMMIIIFPGVRCQYGQTPLGMILNEQHREEVAKLAVGAVTVLGHNYVCVRVMCCRLQDKMNRLIKQQMRVFNVLIPSEKKKDKQKRESFQSYYLTYGKVEPKKIALDEAFLDVADMVRRLGLDELDTNAETAKIIPNPQKVNKTDSLSICAFFGAHSGNHAWRLTLLVVTCCSGL
jgi:hypothetical protein